MCISLQCICTAEKYRNPPVIATAILYTDPALQTVPLEDRDVSEDIPRVGLEEMLRDMSISDRGRGERDGDISDRGRGERDGDISDGGRGESDLHN